MILWNVNHQQTFQIKIYRDGVVYSPIQDKSSNKKPNKRKTIAIINYYY